LTVFLIGITWAGSAGHAWKSASVIAPIIIGFALLAACLAWDFMVAKNPLFPLGLFLKVKEFTVLLVVVFVAGMVFYSMSAILPQMSLYVFTTNGIEIGVISIPNGLGALVGGWVLPTFSHKIRHFKIQIFVALVIETLFVALYAVAVPSHKAAWMAFQFFGQGCFIWITILCYVTASLHVRQKDLGIAAGLIGTFRSGGGSVGNAVFSTILNGVVGGQLGPRIAAAARANGFPASELGKLIPAVIENGVGVPSVFNAIPAATPAVQAATATAFKEAYSYAFQRVSYASVPFGVIAIIAAIFIKDPSMYLTNYTAVHMEKEVILGKTRQYGGRENKVVEKMESENAGASNNVDIEG
jgi:hypothetical protein